MDERDIEVAAAGQPHPDVLESPPQRPLSRRAVTVLVALALMVAAGVGYLAGARRTATPVPGPSPHASTIDDTGLAMTGHVCSAQVGKRLQVGAELINNTPQPAQLRSVRAKLPLGGLHEVASAWGTCGQMPPGPAVAMAPGATGWVTMTFDVLNACPAPLPVEFVVTYMHDGLPDEATVPAFPDLGNVTYSYAQC